MNRIAQQHAWQEGKEGKIGGNRRIREGDRHPENPSLLCIQALRFRLWSFGVWDLGVGFFCGFKKSAEGFLLQGFSEVC